MRADQLWQAALGELRLQLPRATYDTWLKDTLLVSYDPEAGVAVIGAESDVAVDWLESWLRATVQRTLAGIAGRAVEVRFHCCAPEAEEADPPPAAGLDRPAWEPDWPAMGIPPDLVGQSLETLEWARPALAKPALRTYAEHVLDYLRAGIGLMLIGPPGVGKTHLVVALGKVAVRAGWSMEFVTASDFSSRLQRARRGAGGLSADGFSERLAGADLLALDELHVEALTPWVRNRLHEVIGRRYQNGAPILTTSNLTPEELAYPPEGRLGLDERTISRLCNSALVVHLQGSDYRSELKRRKLAAVLQGIEVAAAAALPASPQRPA